MHLSKKTKKDSVMRSAKRKDIIILSLMLIPSAIYYLVFHYLPMFGIVIAFKDYTYSGGIFGSEWIGFKNFKYFFTSQDAVILLRNTILYNVANIFLGVIFGVGTALLLNEIRKRSLLKYYQTTMILPNFMSWVVVSYITYALFDTNYGLINNLFNTQISWYTEPKYWPYILVIVHIWKGIGMSAVMYYAALAGIDANLYEAAQIDGAGKLRQIWHISLPGLRNIIAIMIILGMGSIFRGDFGLFYQVPMDVGNLYSVTDVIDTYVYRGLAQGDYGATSAVGLFQSVVGFITVIIANAVVKKISEESAMF